MATAHDSQTPLVIINDEIQRHREREIFCLLGEQDSSRIAFRCMALGLESTMTEVGLSQREYQIEYDLVFCRAISRYQFVYGFT
jgi:hypothetical protein